MKGITGKDKVTLRGGEHRAETMRIFVKISRESAGLQKAISVSESLIREINDRRGKSKATISSVD